jgi:hypothetical protein
LIMLWFKIISYNNHNILQVKNKYIYI